jgi:hypothetical protein
MKRENNVISLSIFRLFTAFSSQTAQHQMAGLMNDNLERIWMESVTA